MYNFFKNNIEALSRHTSCRLPDKLPANVSVQKTQSGEVTIKYGELLIHSAYDPVKEGQIIAKNIVVGSLVCLYGFGLGYHVQAILDKIGPEGSLVVIELNPDLLASAMILRDQTALLSQKHLHLVFGKEEASVAGKISGHMDHPSHAASTVIFHSPSFKCIPKHFNRIINALEILQMERRGPAVFGDLENSNYALNKETVNRSPGINAYRDSHKNRPAILLSAGPSLDNVLPYLGEMEKHCVIACVDTAFPILSQQGIFPHYVFSLDPQEESFFHFIDNLENTAKLIYTPTANSNIVSCYKGEKIVVFKEGHSLFKYDVALMKEKGATPAGGSVSCLGIDCLIQLGCNPIMLAGQDCMFSGNRTYSRHAMINSELLDEASSFITLEQVHFKKMRETKLVSVENLDGEVFSTNQMMYSYLRNIEQLAETHPKTKIYNLLSRGARIENTTSLGSITDIMKLLPSL